MKKVDFLGFPNCVSLTNDRWELIVTTDVGPRIAFFGFRDGENVLGEHPHAAVPTAIGEWKPYAGHRLWMAPENMPLSYAPDNEPVEYEFDAAKNALRLTAPTEEATKLQKEIVITLADDEVAINHKIINRGAAALEFAPWALTIMRGGGEAIVPNEPFAPYGAENLLPVRSFAVWSYTDFTDARWTFEKEFIRLRSDENLHHAQKIGVFNHRGWAAYEWQDLTFVKRFAVAADQPHPDLNSNVEVYTAGSFIELETLAPLQKVEPDNFAAHTERWQLFRADEVDLSQIN